MKILLLTTLLFPNWATAQKASSEQYHEDSEGTVHEGNANKNDDDESVKYRPQGKNGALTLGDTKGDLTPSKPPARAQEQPGRQAEP